VDKLRMMMLNRAVRRNLIRPYGVQEIPCAESESERDPTDESPSTD